MTYSELWALGSRELESAGVREHGLDARLLLQHACDLDAGFIYAHGTDEVPGEKEALYREYISRRAERIPLQHITGTQGFMGLDFTVSPAVLVPRADTETLVECALKELHDGMRILDVCTGSGCILLSLLKYSNDCEGVGLDISPEALSVARLNSDKLGIAADFIESDLFAEAEGKFDLLVSNPPYIRTAEIETLEPEVKEHDPMLALDGHEDGLFFYRRIINECPQYLNRGAWVFFEIGEDQGEDVSNLLKEAGFKDVSVAKDLAGLNRVVAGRFA